MQKVDFFIVGQPKSGTTALAHFLDKHPNICISIPKETGYMSKDHIAESDSFHKGPKYFHIRTKSQYSNAFKHASPGQILGDASTNYLYSKTAAAEIFKHNPKAKIIIMLRNPVDMIYSLYLQYNNETKEDIGSFKEALEAERFRKKGRKLPKNIVTPSYVLYKSRGLYGEQIKRYLKIFNKSQIHFIVTEQFRQNNAGSYKNTLKFLNVDDSFSPEFKSIHESKAPRSNTVNKMINAHFIKSAALKTLGQHSYTRVQRKIIEPLIFKRVQRNKLDDSLRNELESFFYSDVNNLSKIIGIDLLKIWGFHHKPSL